MTDLAALYRQEAARVRKHCYYHVRGDWENVAASVWLKALEAIARGNGPAPETEIGWLWSIVHTQIIDYQRHRKSQEHWIDIYASRQEREDHSIECIERRIYASWLLERAGLTVYQATIIERRYIQEMLLREVGVEFGSDMNVVKSVQDRGMKKLRALAEQEVV